MRPRINKNMVEERAGEGRAADGLQTSRAKVGSGDVYMPVGVPPPPPRPILVILPDVLALKHTSGQ